MVYVAFVIDAYSRRILGWRAATSMRTALVLDALEHAVWTRTRDGAADLGGLICHHDAGSQYTSIAYTERLADAGVDPSVGSVGDAYDNALAESVIGLFKTELIKPRGPWRTVEQVEIATLEWVDWFNHHRLFEACGHIPPAELEAAHYRQQAALTESATQHRRSPDTPGGFNQTVITTFPRTWPFSSNRMASGAFIERVAPVHARDDLAVLDECGEPLEVGGALF